jgi:anaerobic dimethyl sulfoxide reductase subunit C (anchor subunit)
LPDRDWSLVFFTTLSQLSIGIVVCFTVLVYFDNGAGFFIETGLGLKNPALLALIFVGVATVTSFLHLGNPANAPNALNNLSGSWLSREILALSGYSLSLLIVIGAGWKIGNIASLKYYLALSSAIGIVLLWMMVRIYTVPTIPAWNTWFTPLSFILTTLCLGLLTVLCLHQLGIVNIEKQVNGLMTFLIIVLFLEIVSGLVHHIRLEKIDTGIDDIVFNKGTFYWVFLFRMGILITAFLVLLVIIFKPEVYPGAGSYAWIYPLMIFVIAQELLGRLLFYSSYFRIGV